MAVSTIPSGQFTYRSLFSANDRDSFIKQFCADMYQRLPLKTANVVGSVWDGQTYYVGIVMRVDSGTLYYLLFSSTSLDIGRYVADTDTITRRTATLT